MRFSAVDEQRGDDARPFAGESLVVRWTYQRPFETGRFDFQRIPILERFEPFVDPRRHALAERDVDASLTIDGHDERDDAAATLRFVRDDFDLSERGVVRDGIEFPFERDL
jgi:hypothetical protein